MSSPTSLCQAGAHDEAESIHDSFAVGQHHDNFHDPRLLRDFMDEEVPMYLRLPTNNCKPMISVLIYPNPARGTFIIGLVEGIHSHEVAEELVRNGFADYIFVSRPLI